MTRFNILLFAALISLSATYTSCNNNPGFSIDGTLSGESEGAVVKLINPESPSATAIDSTVVENGKFTLNGVVDQPGLYSIIIDLNAPGTTEPDFRNKMLKANFYLENSQMTFEGDVATLPAYYYNPERTGIPKITGSESQDLYENFRESIKEISDSLSKLDKRYSQEYIIPEFNGTDASAIGIEIVKAEKALNNKKKEAEWKFITENPSSVVAFDQASYIINGYSSTPTSAEIDTLLSILAPHWNGTDRYERLKEIASTTKTLAIGEPYIDLELLDRDGNKVMLSSMIPDDKYVMLEFWASWCGPCRAEIPHLAKVHEKYPDFEIISISVDSEDNAWSNAMSEEGMTWTQLRNTDGMEGDVKDKYNIYGIPTCIVLDKNGKFLRNNMRGAYLDEFLNETYGF